MRISDWSSDVCSSDLAELAYGIKLTYDNLSVKPKSRQEMRRQDQNLSVLRNDPRVRRRGRPANNAAHSVPEQRMLDLAFHSFAQKGYEGTTLRDLAKQLGVSHNLLNVRFGSKADLWRCAVDAQIAIAAPPVFQAFDFPGMNDEQRLREQIGRASCRERVCKYV